tara:strand:- start:190 stop:462 length:273 start_codon:yes stop_codon:yes gene_type:complete
MAAFDVNFAILFILGWLCEHDVLKLQVSVDDLAVVTIVDGIKQLYEQVEGILFGEPSIWLCLPEIIKLSTFEVLHYDKKLLLFGKREVVI